MDKRNPRAAFVAALLKQEQPVSDAQYTEYRRRLEQKIMKAARRERVMRDAALLTGLVAVFSIPALLILDRLALPTGVKDVLYLALATLSACALPFLLLYFLRYRRALDRARQESRDALLMELQRKIAELGDQPPAS